MIYTSTAFADVSHRRLVGAHEPPLPVPRRVGRLLRRHQQEEDI